MPTDTPLGHQPDPVVDPHRSKISPDDPRLRLPRPQARSLKRGPALAMAAVIGVVITIAIVSAFGSPSPAEQASSEQAQSSVAPAEPVALPEEIRNAPDNSDPVGLALRDPVPPSPDPKASLSAPDAGPQEMPPAPSDLPLPPADDTAALERQARGQALAKALGSGTAVLGADHESLAPLLPPGTASSYPASSMPGQPNASPSGGDQDPNLQRRKEQFLASAADSPAGYLPQRLQRPVSPYEVKAGTIVPAVLLTGLNSDLPGQVLAQVRENVYDTVSGNHLLIPQGSRLLAVYDSMTAFGQDRILVCWSRLIRPDGSSLNLECMPGVDLSGSSGFADQVDHHWGRIVTGVVLSSLLAATTQSSQGDVSGVQPSFPQIWASNTASTINGVGQELTRKNLGIQPTIKIRPGFSVNLLVSRDLVLSPYNYVKSPDKM